MNNSVKNWFEVWYVDGVDTMPAYLVIVTPDLEQYKEIVVIDAQNKKIIYRGESYQDVYEWLIEDEFSLIKGRVSEIS